MEERKIQVSFIESNFEVYISELFKFERRDLGIFPSIDRVVDILFNKNA